MDTFAASKSRIVGAYELLSLLSRSGFREVFKARRLSDGSEVAVKRVLFGRNPRSFVKQVKLLQDLSSPYIVNHFDVVEIQDMCFLVLEYLNDMPAGSLHSRIQGSGKGLEVKEALNLFINYLQGLEHLHRSGLIHRNIKPDNLYAPEGQPERAKILDLGITFDMLYGRKSHRTGPPLQRTSDIMDYMPPEYFTFWIEFGSPQSDLYSLGVSFYETLTGHLPWPRLPTDKREALLAHVARSETPPTPAFDHPVFQSHPFLQEVLRMALSIDSRKRYRSAAELRAQLEDYLTRLCKS